MHAGLTIVPDQFRPLHVLLYVGQRGVQLFYLVSAFTLFYTLDIRANELHPVRNFYLRRFFRIAPLFYLDLLFHAVRFGFGMKPWLYLSAFVFLNGWSHTAIEAVPAGWSIAVETTFYAFVPFLFAKIKSLGQAIRWFLLGTALTVPFCYFLAFRHGDSQFYIFLWFPAQIPIFLLGIVTYFLWKTMLGFQQNSSGTDSLLPRRDLGTVLLLFTAALLFGTVNVHAEGPSRLYWGNEHMIVASLGFVSLLLGVSVYQTPLLVNRVTRLIGRVSYSMYLTHPYVIEAIMTIQKRWFANRLVNRFQNTATGAVLMFLLLLAASIPVAAIFWRVVEQPGIWLGRLVIAASEARSSQLNSSMLTEAKSAEDSSTLDAQF